MEFSADLQAKLKALTVAQRRAIAMIVGAEMERLPVTRVFKTIYSCRWCGRVIGRTGLSDAERKKGLAGHELECERKGKTWYFAASSSTYYGEWLKEPAFVEALDQARIEATASVLDESLRLLQFGTVEVVRELLRLALEAEDSSDRIRAGLGVLDRAAALTAKKGKIEVEHTEKQKRSGKVVDLLNRLRGKE